MSTLFISDLHLSPQRPKMTQLFLDFLKLRAKKAQTLYILGDFFDVWIGDDAMDEFAHSIVAALRSLADSGVKIFLMPGNRDFLYGRVFSAQSGVTLIADPTCVDLYGTRTLLVHGDSLCTTDKKFQFFRYLVRHPLLCGIYLRLPLSARINFANFLRSKSTRANKQKSAYLMDVSQESVEAMMRRYQATRLIHGHTHDPNTHQFTLDDKPVTRIVLGAWENSGWVLSVDESSMHTEILEV